MPEPSQMRETAAEIFRAALRAADARAAVRREVRLDGRQLRVRETEINLAVRPGGIYSIAIGKAAWTMAVALDSVLGRELKGAIAVVPSGVRPSIESVKGIERVVSLPERWRVFEGGHPLPNEESLAAAQAAFELLQRAERQRALIIFLISGGGSALLEWPRDESTTLDDLRAFNRMLVNCGASIAEINAVRRAVSAVKGGGLSARARHTDQLTLIISDTNEGEEANVASGPTIVRPSNEPDTKAIIARYGLSLRLPPTILRSVNEATAAVIESPPDFLRQHYVLLSNEQALAAAAEAARSCGLVVEIARDIIEQEIDEGCEQLIRRLQTLCRDAGRTKRPVCLISGGEFACPVRGDGLGGRNSETALRLALLMEALSSEEKGEAAISRFVLLSAGTDGIDGNSPAAGALADETTLGRARSLGLDARRSLETSDAYSFFAALGDTIETGPTGTNVRDVRVLLAV